MRTWNIGQSFQERRRLPSGKIPSSDAAFPHPSSEVLRNRPMQQLRRWRGESLRPSSRLPSEEA
jgi:hypothetical protein